MLTDGRIAKQTRVRSFAALVVTVLGFVAVASPASAGPAATLKCDDWIGNPTPGSAEWNEVDVRNQQCAAEGFRILEASPAVAAAQAEPGMEAFFGDPFRAPQRWAKKRGTYELTTYTARDGTSWPAALFGPRDADGGPYPGVLLVCHVCGPSPSTAENAALWYWAAQPLAEAGYVVMYAGVGGNSVDRAIDATNYFTATESTPTAQGDFNPWHDRLDRDRLGIIGHSGAAGVALTVGNTDDQYDAIVAWDPARSFSFDAVTPRIPTMVVLADYTRDGTEVRSAKPVPEPGSRFTFVDTISAAGVDAMQVAVRSATHIDWTHFTGMNHSIYGEMVATYYTLAWLDRNLSPPRSPRARQARQRLTASGADRFDRSADVHSIGAGFFDASKADRAGDATAGNVPIKLRGIPIRNLLSFQYDSSYSLDDGARRCADLRAACR